ncbi:MAG: ABC transporter permease [Hyphomicrobiaceae bacterium]|nr:ABC transporter permease [Hyphomicrobiaceae bacterium]
MTIGTVDVAGTDTGVVPVHMRRPLWRDPVFVGAGTVLLIHVFLALLAPLIIPYPPDQMSFSATLQPPSLEHWFGTDRYGRDLLSRVIMGGQLTLAFGFGSVAMCLLIGLPAGLISAYYGGLVDQVIMRTMDILMSFPTLLLGLLILIIAGPDLGNLIIAVGIVYCPRTTRVVRAAALTVRHSAFIEAAQARGESSAYIIVRELLPCAWGAIIVEICIRLGYAILLGASFNYLGLGVQPPAADWGLLVHEARSQMLRAPWTAIFPILFITTLVSSLHLLGDTIDERLKEGDVG